MTVKYVSVNARGRLGDTNITIFIIYITLFVFVISGELSHFYIILFINLAFFILFRNKTLINSYNIALLRSYNSIFKNCKFQIAHSVMDEMP